MKTPEKRAESEQIWDALDDWRHDAAECDGSHSAETSAEELTSRAKAQGAIADEIRSALTDGARLAVQKLLDDATKCIEQRAVKLRAEGETKAASEVSEVVAFLRDVQLGFATSMALKHGVSPTVDEDTENAG